MRVLQKVLSLGSDYFSATFYQTYFYYKPSNFQSIPPLLKSWEKKSAQIKKFYCKLVSEFNPSSVQSFTETHFLIFLPSREKGDK